MLMFFREFWRIFSRRMKKQNFTNIQMMNEWFVVVETKEIPYHVAYHKNWKRETENLKRWYGLSNWATEQLSTYQHYTAIQALNDCRLNVYDDFNGWALTLNCTTVSRVYSHISFKKLKNDFGRNSNHMNRIRN